MKILPTFCQWCVLVVFATTVAPVRADVPPSEYIAAKQKAKEVLHIKVVKAVYTGSRENKIHYRCQARVTQVKRSSRSYRVGSMISFDTWHIAPPLAARIGYAGPAIPRHMYAGWSGLVFLNPVGNADVLKLAAHGRSFESDRKTLRRERRAQRHFERMERNLAMSQTIQFSYVSKGENGRITNKTWIGRGNRVRVELAFSPSLPLVGGELIVVSNGNKYGERQNYKSAVGTPPHLRENFVYGFARISGSRAILGFPPGEGGDEDQRLKDTLRVCNFGLGEPEKINGRWTHVVHYTVVDSSNAARQSLHANETKFKTINATLHIDVKTSLPLRRTTSLNGDQNQEEYKVRLNKEINEAHFQFELPA